ncbi:type II and III secretion system protein family protein [Pectinatus sottacetonis]|uniref:type II and III secretion system protein family protein n=1 Tax=Pectinatus sottacetonis TaxID=1002795 RepID=UPI0018C540F4|nr:pilus assembly protein N-terminal domain-containing protein [Pectinatus sottacetonis]
MKKDYIIRWVMLLLVCIFASAVCNNKVFAEPTALSIGINKSYSLDTGGNISRIAVADPSIADATAAAADNLLIVAKKPGATTLWVWTQDGMEQQFIVNVVTDNTDIEAAIRAAMPGTNVQVQKSGDNILLRGKVKNQYQKDTAEKIAGLYGSKVVDLLQMSDPFQIRIEAQVIEISMDKEKNLGFLFSNPANIESATGIVTLGTTGSFAVGQTFNRSYADLDATLQAMEKKGDARILSRPNIMTLSGKKASILIGGKIPIPVSNKDGNVTIEWRDYGIKLNVEPVVDAAENITTNVKAEVSTLDYSHEVKNNSFSIPALSSREASTDITMKSGATMAIGGLINSQESKTITKMPILGNLPIIGQFFRHTSKTRDKRELIILITPTLVNADTPVKMSSDMEKYYAKNQEDSRKDIDVNKEKSN